jgi:hypothetical protein
MENLFEFFHPLCSFATYQSLDHSWGLHFTLQLHTCTSIGICVVFALCCDIWNKLDGETILWCLVFSCFYLPCSSCGGATIPTLFFLHGFFSYFLQSFLHK